MLPETGRTGISYADAGVDRDRSSDAIARMRSHIESTLPSDGSAGKLGHFGGAYRLQSGPDRILVSSADGVGTKIKIAITVGGAAHRGIGRDLVNHCVNDLLACGARPLFFLDYIAMGELDPEVVEQLVAGLADGCRINETALVGGETAEMPGIYVPGDYDLAGFIVGEVAPEAYIDGSAIQAGSLLLGLPAIGLHTNGYSLARTILGLTGDPVADTLILDRPFSDDRSLTIGDALLAAHPSYLTELLPLLDTGRIQGMAHITGGGLVDNIPRMLGEDLVAEFDPDSWPVPPLEKLLVEQGKISEHERFRAMNMGLGFVLANSPEDLALAKALVPQALEVGRVRLRHGDEPQVAGLFGDGD